MLVSKIFPTTVIFKSLSISFVVQKVDAQVQDHTFPFYLNVILLLWLN